MVKKNLALTLANEKYWLPELRNQSMEQHIYIYEIIDSS